jgi:penicillin-binding protein 2
MAKRTRWQSSGSSGQDSRLTTRRAFAGIAFIGLMILFLLARIAYLQILEHHKYATLSDRNQLRLVPIPPNRGLIYDRNGKLLARNLPAFHLAVLPEQVSNLNNTLNELEKIIPITPEQRHNFLDKVAHTPPYQRQFYKLKLSEVEVSTFAVNQYRFPGVALSVELMRDYPYGASLAHILGYVSEASRNDLNTIDRKRYAGTFHLGKMGLEKYYEDLLQGQPGYHQKETNVVGREVRTVSTHPATSGKDLHLTLDINLQEATMKAFGESKGALVALDPRNGEILAMVSNPSFDPNLFVRGIDKATYAGYRQDPHRPLFNRAIQGKYPPASTVKPLLGLAGLSTKKISRHNKVFDPGWYQINGAGRLYRDWEERGHGWTDFEKAIRESCDVYFYVLSEKLGIHQISTWFSHVGFGKLTGVDLPAEQAGIVPSATWKKKALGTVWYPGETLITGIGQGYTLTTPLQLAVMASYFANQGQAYRPHFNKDAAPVKLPYLKLDNPNDWAHVIDAMHQVVKNQRGTAYRYFNGSTLEVAGKTGTAQVFGLKANEKYDHEGTAHHLRDHSLFICFAPVDKPTIAIAIILENQKASAVVARQVLETYFGVTPDVEENDDDPPSVSEE